MHSLSPRRNRSWRSLGTEVDDLAFYVAAFLALILAAYGIVGAVDTRLQGREFIGADRAEQVSMLSRNPDGPYLGPSRAPMFRCSRSGPVGSRIVPLDYIHDPVGLCDLARRNSMQR